MPQGNWFGPTENISSGWTPYHYTAPDIGGLVRGILENRQWQQQNLQNQMKTLGQTIQAQRQNEAFGEQASNAGLLPGVDTSGMSADQIKNLATLVKEQGDEATMATYRQALGGAATTRAQAAQDYADLASQTQDTQDTGPQTKVVNGVTYVKRMGAKGVENWVPVDPASARPGKMKDYTQGVGVSGLDLNQTWPSSADPDSWEIPILNPDWDSTKPTSQKYLQVPNPKFNSTLPASPTNSPSISHTVRVPKSVYDQWQTGGTAETTDDDSGAGTGGGTGTGGAGTGTTQPGGASTGTGGTGAQTVTAPQPQKPITPGEKIDPATTALYITKAHGNTAVARRMAVSDGWTF